MSEFENIKAVELNENEMTNAAGGASRYDKLTPKAGFVIYTVRTGDSLGKIARSHSCTVNEILAWNPKITNPDKIYAGEQLYLRA